MDINIVHLLSSRLYCRLWNHTKSCLTACGLRIYKCIPPAGNHTLPWRLSIIHPLLYPITYINSSCFFQFTHNFAFPPAKSNGKIITRQLFVLTYFFLSFINPLLPVIIIYPVFWFKVCPYISICWYNYKLIGFFEVIHIITIFCFCFM